MRASRVIKIFFCVLPLFTALPSQSAAPNRSLAKLIYQRIAGRPPTNLMLDSLEKLAEKRDYAAIADQALLDDEFYRVTLTSYIKKKVSSINTIDTTLNDSVALGVGLAYNNEAFHQLLFGNILYTANNNVTGLTSTIVANAAIPAYSMDNNLHFEYLESANENIAGVIKPLEAWHKKLRKSPQVTEGGVTGVYTTLGSGIALEDAAGIFTTRGLGSFIYNAGTNRKAFNFLVSQFMCSTLAEVHNTSAPDDRIRQDIDRCPGGKCSDFKSSCVGCHSVMDPAIGAFAFFDFDQSANPANGQQRLQYKVKAQGAPDALGAGSVQGKYLRSLVEANRRTGYVTTDNTWVNNLYLGPNARFFADPSNAIKSGKGAQSFTKMIAESKGFAECLAKEMFEVSCSRVPTNEELIKVNEKALSFQKNNYQLKSLIRDVTQVCYEE